MIPCVICRRRSWFPSSTQVKCLSRRSDFIAIRWKINTHGASPSVALHPFSPHPVKGALIFYNDKKTKTFSQPHLQCTGLYETEYIYIVKSQISTLKMKFDDRQELLFCCDSVAKIVYWAVWFLAERNTMRLTPYRYRPTCTPFYCTPNLGSYAPQFTNFGTFLNARYFIQTLCYLL